MTDNEIIGALEDLIEQATDVIDWVMNKHGAEEIRETASNSLDLINRQKAEIEDLQGNLKFVRGTVERMRKYDEERDIRLHARLTETARAETIKEFAERLKSKIDVVYSIKHLKDSVDGVAEDMTCRRECPDCKCFVGCEAACGGRVCDSFEAKKPQTPEFIEDALKDFCHFLADAAEKQPICVGDIPDLLGIFKGGTM